jgi:hypothetical protein
MKRRREVEPAGQVDVSDQDGHPDMVLTFEHAKYTTYIDGTTEREVCERSHKLAGDGTLVTRRSDGTYVETASGRVLKPM